MVTRSSSTSMRSRPSCRSRPSSCSTETKPKADLTEDIKRNGPDKRQRTPQETMRPAMAAAVISPYEPHPRGVDVRDSGAKLEEAVGLARAIDLDVRLAATAPLRRVTRATLIGEGVVEGVHDAVE